VAPVVLYFRQITKNSLITKFWGETIYLQQTIHDVVTSKSADIHMLSPNYIFFQMVESREWLVFATTGGIGEDGTYQGRRG
jgi:hypothetical protein